MDNFTNKYINNFDILKKSVIGFEFEFYTNRSYYRLLELLNRELAPIKIHGRRKYHSEFVPDEENFKLEPDYSLGGEGIELIAGPLPYTNARILLLKILKILQDYAKTDEKCSIHINISFDKDLCDRDVEKVNKLKMILDIDEDLIYKLFPDRKNNFYAKSIKKLIPFKGYDYSTDAANILISNLQLSDDTKYYGVNLKEVSNGRLEFRYIGGEDYQFKTKEIMELMDYFVLLSWNCINENLTKENIQNLKKFLDENISIFRNFTRLESFIGEFPTIQVEVDKDSNFLVVKGHYSQIVPELYELMRNTNNLNNCILNYDTSEKRLEVVDANLRTTFTLKGMNVFDSNVTGGEYHRCEFNNCDVKEAHMHNCKVYGTDVFNSKLENTDTDEYSTLRDVYYEGGMMCSNFEKGVMRGGIVGEGGQLGDVQIISDTSSYFGNKLDDTVDKDVGKGKSKGTTIVKKEKF